MKTTASQPLNESDLVRDLVASARREAHAKLVTADPDHQVKPQGKPSRRAAVANCGTCDA
jgi:hypothetical protein